MAMMLPRLLGAVVGLVVAGIAATVPLAPSEAATIAVLRCTFENAFEVYFTFYNDGTPTRVGRSTGIGDRAETIKDKRTGAIVVIELNVEDIPITMTTITPDLSAVHSRQIVQLDGSVLAPSQQRGKCERVPIG